LCRGARCILFNLVSVSQRPLRSLCDSVTCLVFREIFRRYEICQTG
jgi:hypothetical protein